MQDSNEVEKFKGYFKLEEGWRLLRLIHKHDRLIADELRQVLSGLNRELATRAVTVGINFDQVFVALLVEVQTAGSFSPQWKRALDHVEEINHKSIFRERLCAKTKEVLARYIVDSDQIAAFLTTVSAQNVAPELEGELNEVNPAIIELIKAQLETVLDRLLTLIHLRAPIVTVLAAGSAGVSAGVGAAAAGAGGLAIAGAVATAAAPIVLLGGAARFGFGYARDHWFQYEDERKHVMQTTLIRLLEDRLRATLSVAVIRLIFVDIRHRLAPIPFMPAAAAGAVVPPARLRACTMTDIGPCYIVLEDVITKLMSLADHLPHEQHAEWHAIERMTIADAIAQFSSFLSHEAMSAFCRSPVTVEIACAIIHVLTAKDSFVLELNQRLRRGDHAAIKLGQVLGETLVSIREWTAEWNPCSGETLFRGISSEVGAQFAALTAGQVICFTGCTATSKSEMVARRFGEFLFRIESNPEFTIGQQPPDTCIHPVSLENISRYPGELEVLFAPCTFFRCLRNDMEHKTITLIPLLFPLMHRCAATILAISKN